MKHSWSYWKALLLVIVLSWTLAGCSKSPPASLSSFEAIISEGFGLSEEAFFKRFAAGEHENWEKKTGQESADSLEGGLLTYTLYTVSEPVDFSELSCTMTLKFYDEQGLGMVTYTADEKLNDDALYTRMLGCYQTVSDKLGLPVTEEMQWNRYASRQDFLDDVAAGGGYTYSEAVRMQSARWDISTRISGGEYDQFAVLQVLFDWPIGETADTSWMFSVSRSMTV